MTTRSMIISSCLAASALLVAGCSGGSTQKTGVTDQPTAAGLQSAAAREADDFFDLRVQAYFNDLSAGCRKQTTIETLAAVLTTANASAKNELPAGLAGLKAGAVQTRDVTATKGQALVAIVRTDGSAFGAKPSYADYVYESGKWRTTVCGTS